MLLDDDPDEPDEPDVLDDELEDDEPELLDDESDELLVLPEPLSPDGFEPEPELRESVR